MFSIDYETNNISLTRGDTLYIQIDLMRNNEPYIMLNGDIIRFAMKQNLTDDECLIKKVLSKETDSSVVLHLEPNDTKPLPFKKRYHYDIEITTETGDVFTFLEGDFYLAPEVD